MKKLVPALAGLLVVIAGALSAQAQTVSPPARQRAPGVPLAPRSGEAGRPTTPDNGASRDEKRGLSENKPQAPVRPDRDLPMPKPVPSIIAP